MEQERILSYELAQKLDEADLENVSGGSLSMTHFWTHGDGGVDYTWDS